MTSPLAMLAFAIFPLVTAVDIISSPFAAAALLGYWLCLEMISKSSTLTIIKKKGHEVQPVISVVFDHSMDAEITTFGSLYQWTSSHFESHHRRLQININQTTTNSANLIIEKYLPSKKVRAFFNEECANASRPLLSLAEKFENKHLKRFPVGILINDYIYIPKRSRVCAADLCEPEKTRVLRSGEEPYSRLVIRNKIYSSGKYWSRNTRSRQDLVYLNGIDGSEEIEVFASVVLFLYN
ncbi:hypothetical protein ANCCAN_30681, partial [Ancylostoma caninum]